jgi:hypothetical protein
MFSPNLLTESPGISIAKFRGIAIVHPQGAAWCLPISWLGRNLLKAKVTAEHVAGAVLFFATRQTPTTGATIPVDGGLPDSTPR